MLVPKDHGGEIFPKRILEWLTWVGAIATALAGIIGVFLPDQQAKPIAFAIAFLFLLVSGATYYYQRRRAARLEIPEALEPLVPSAALRGLLPFEEGDTLPGRARDVQEVYTLVTSSIFRFGVLWGESGCGKTSLFRAALVPMLRKNGFLPLYISKPTNEPQEAIRATLKRDSASVAWREDEDVEDLLRAVAPKGKNVIVVLDQFEEFFLTNRTQKSRASFTKWLGKLVADASLPVVFLIGIREDFFAQLQNLAPYVPEPTSPRTTYQLQNFNTEQAKQILNAAAKADAIPFDTALIDAVVSDLETEGFIRPSELQVVGTRLKRRNILNLNKYEVAGRAKGILSSYIVDEIKLSADEQIARLILRLMCADDGLSKSPNDLSLGEVARGIGEGNRHDIVQGILNQFTSARILIHTDEDKYNLVHDYLAPYIRLATEGAETKVERANRLLRRYLAEYREDTRRLVPFRQTREIEKHASPELKVGERAKDLLKKSLRRFYLKTAFFLSPLVILLGLYIIQGNSYYLSTQPSDIESEKALIGLNRIVIRSGLPQLKFLPGLAPIAVVTDFRYLDTDRELSNDQVTGFWFDKTIAGYDEWGEALIKILKLPYQARALRWLNQSEKAAVVLVDGLLDPKADQFSQTDVAESFGELVGIVPQAVTSHPELIQRLTARVIDSKASSNSRLIAAYGLAYIAQVNPQVATPEVIRSITDLFTNSEGYFSLNRQTEFTLGQLLKANPQLATRQNIESLLSIISDPNIKSARRYNAASAISQFAQANPQIITSDVALVLVLRVTDPKANYTFRKDVGRALVGLKQANPGVVIVSSELVQSITAIIKDTNADPSLRVDAAFVLGGLTESYPQGITPDVIQAVLDLIADSRYESTLHWSAGYALIGLVHANPKVVTAEMVKSLVALSRNDYTLRNTMIDILIDLAHSNPQVVSSETLEVLIPTFLDPEKLPDLREDSVEALDQLVKANPQIATLELTQPLFESVVNFDHPVSTRFYVARVLGQFARANPKLVTKERVQSLHAVVTNRSVSPSSRKDAAYALGEFARANPQAVKVTPVIIQSVVSLLREDLDVQARLVGSYSLYLFAIGDPSQVSLIRSELARLGENSKPHLRFASTRALEMPAIADLVHEARMQPEQLGRIKTRLKTLTRRTLFTFGIGDISQDHIFFVASIALDEIAKIEKR